uniref:MRN complex-interacting protein N-terminal domain-containing protein n=1 Tax=Anopheles dirus TaxID=7168 RepID=A0A1Y9H2K9_9DIPT
MPQELRVVRCFQCLKYQVDIVKKANKWVCKVCGVKQSLTREFFRGTGKDCRSMVQQLSMRNVLMDQQEAEVAELVLQNKLQLPRPPPPTVPASVVTEQTEGPQKPSKWESYLAKDENDEQTDCLTSASEVSLESVSSTTFDRERINCPEKKLVTGGKRKCVNYWESANNFQSGNSSKSNSSTYLAKEKVESMNSFQPRKRALENSSTKLFDFHRKETMQRTFSGGSEAWAHKLPAHSPFKNSSSSSSEQLKPSEMPYKRKQFNSNTTPLMNFGKRPVSENIATPPPGNQLSESVYSKVFHTKDVTQFESKPGATSSKWAKFLPEDDETNENTDDNFITF